MVLPRALMALFSTPVRCAQFQFNQTRKALDTEKALEELQQRQPQQQDGFNYTAWERIKLGYQIALDFLVGCALAPVLAVQAALDLNRDERTVKSFLKAVLTIPVRFVIALFTTPFAYAKDQILPEKVLIQRIRQEKAEKEQPKRKEIKGAGGHVRAFLWGLAGFLYGIVFSPLVGISAANIAMDPGIGSPPRDESSMAIIVKAPFRFIIGTLYAPFVMAYNWAKPLEKEQPKDAALNASSHQQIATAAPGMVFGKKAAGSNQQKPIRHVHFNLGKSSQPESDSGNSLSSPAAVRASAS